MAGGSRRSSVTRPLTLSSSALWEAQKHIGRIRSLGDVGRDGFEVVLFLHAAFLCGVQLGSIYRRSLFLMDVPVVGLCVCWLAKRGLVKFARRNFRVFGHTSLRDVLRTFVAVVSLSLVCSFALVCIILVLLRQSPLRVSVLALPWIAYFARFGTLRVAEWPETPRERIGFRFAAIMFSALELSFVSTVVPVLFCNVQAVAISWVRSMFLVLISMVGNTVLLAAHAIDIHRTDLWLGLMQEGVWVEADDAPVGHMPPWRDAAARGGDGAPLQPRVRPAAMAVEFGTAPAHAKAAVAVASTARDGQTTGYKPGSIVRFHGLSLRAVGTDVVTAVPYSRLLALLLRCLESPHLAVAVLAGVEVLFVWITVGGAAVSATGWEVMLAASACEVVVAAYLLWLCARMGEKPMNAQNVWLKFVRPDEGLGEGDSSPSAHERASS